MILILIAVLIFATPSGAPDPVFPVQGRALRGVPHERAVAVDHTPSALAMTAAPLFTGQAGWAAPSLGRSYLAARLPRGTVVTITGPGGSWTTAVTDYGPSSKIRPARVADIAVGQWERICGLPRSAGLCRVSISAGGNDVAPTGPPTDVGP